MYINFLESKWANKLTCNIEYCWKSAKATFYYDDKENGSLIYDSVSIL